MNTYNNQQINEAVYLYSAMKANVARCEKRFVYWKTIHEHRANVLNKPSLVNKVSSLGSNGLSFIKQQAI